MIIVKTGVSYRVDDPLKGTWDFQWYGLVINLTQ